MILFGSLEHETKYYKQGLFVSGINRVYLYRFWSYTRISYCCPRKTNDPFFGSSERDTNYYKQGIFVPFLVVYKDPCCWA